MDPVSAMMMLGAGALWADWHEGGSRHHGSQNMLMALGMTPRQPGVAGESDLPDALSSDDPVESLWRTFEVDPIVVDLSTHTFQWVDDRESFDTFFPGAMVAGALNRVQNQIGRWEIRGFSSSDSPVTLWDLLQRAWLGRSPDVVIHVSYSSAGKSSTSGSTITVSHGLMEVDLTILGEDVDETASAVQDRLLDEEDVDLIGSSFRDSFVAKISNATSIEGDHFELGVLCEEIQSESFSDTMKQLSEILWTFSQEVDSTVGEVESEIWRIANECAEQAWSDAEEIRSERDDREDDEDGEEDEWETDEDEDED